MRLILIGAGGFARELIVWLRRSNLADTPLAGVLTDGRPIQLPADCDLPFFGAADQYQLKPGDRFLCAIGDPETRLRMVRSLESRGADFATMVHDAAVVGDRIELGAGTMVCPGAILTADIKVGRHVLINVAASVGHDAAIGDFCTLSGHVDVTGGAKLGTGVFVGSHGCVAPKIEVGDWATVGAGSVVVRRVKRRWTVFGAPARHIRERPSGDELTA